MGDNIEKLETINIGGFIKLVKQTDMITVTAIKKKFVSQLDQLPYGQGLDNLEVIGIIERYKIIAKDSKRGIVWVHINDLLEYLTHRLMRSGDISYKVAGNDAYEIINGFPQLFQD